MILYVIDIGSLDHAAEVALLRHELREYSPALLDRPAIVVLNKADLAAYDRVMIAEISAPLRNDALWPERDAAPPVLAVSALEKRGLEALLDTLFALLPEATLAEQALPGAAPPPAIEAPAASSGIAVSSDLELLKSGEED